MKLSDIFVQLSINEFSKLSIAGEDQGVINEKNWDNIIPQIQLGLTALYTRFNLKEGSIAIELTPGMNEYFLSSKYAKSNKKNKEGPFIIHDSELNKFKDDILKIKSITNLYGREYPLNESGERFGIQMLTPTTIQLPAEYQSGANDIPEWMVTSMLFIRYWANHPKIVRNIGYFDPERVEVELPQAYLEPLLYYVASRVHNPVGMVNEFNAGNNYAAKYEESCQRLEARNLDIDDFGYRDKGLRFRRAGWV